MPMTLSAASSNRWMMRPARPRTTASGFSTTSVRSRPSPGAAGVSGVSGPVPGSVREAAELTGCEQRLQPDRRPGVPTVAIVGASITAGVGAEDPAGSWALLLARQLRWNAFVYGV